jgi:hypothetical protein
MVLIDNQVHWPLCYGSLVAGAGFEPASQVYETCGLPLSHPASQLVHVEGFEPPVLWVTALQAAAVAAGPHMHGGAQLSRTVIPHRSLRVQAGYPHRWRYAPIQKLVVAARVERASPEGTSRFERDGLSDCPTLPPPQRRKTCRRGPRSLAVGAGLEPAHASRREPRL